MFSWLWGFRLIPGEPHIHWLGNSSYVGTGISVQAKGVMYWQGANVLCGLPDLIVHFELSGIAKPEWEGGVRRTDLINVAKGVQRAFCVTALENILSTLGISRRPVVWRRVRNNNVDWKKLSRIQQWVCCRFSCSSCAFLIFFSFNCFSLWF